MNQIISIWEELTRSYGIGGVALMAALTVLFFIQIYIYLFRYGRIPSFRNGSMKAADRGVRPLSVITVLGDDYDYLENTLPRLLTQDYERFEVVLVYVGSNEAFIDTLSGLCLTHANLTVTKIELDPRFPISNKMAINLGIKAARYDDIVVTTADAAPRSRRWLSFMAQGFASGEVVIGYCATERKPGFINRCIGCSRLMHSVRYLSRAACRKPYRATVHNMGFSKELYFKVRGFNYLGMNIGDDDLFVQRLLSRAASYSLVMTPSATVTQKVWGGMGWWYKERTFFGYAFRYYPGAVKRAVAAELWSRCLFFAAAVAALVLLPVEIKWGAAALLLLRYLLVASVVWRIGRRLGDRGYLFVYPLYDLFAPLSEALMFVVRNRKPSAGIWR